MEDARQLWPWRQSLLAWFGPVFTRPGWVRFGQWVTRMVMGDLLPAQPWTFLPHSSRLYFRHSQLPEGETLRTKTQWAVELLHSSILVLRRFFRRHRAKFSKLLLRLEEIEKVPQVTIHALQRPDIAA